MRRCACEVLSPGGDECRTQQKPVTVVKSGYIAGPVGSATDSSGSDIDEEHADQCSTLVLETLPWKNIRISLVGLYSRSQLLGYCAD